MSLDVETFEAAAFDDIVAHCLRAGIVFATIEQLGDHESNHRRLYELNRVCSADIPERGDFYTYAEYRAARIEQDSYNPNLIVLALDAGEWVGMSAASDHRRDGYAFNEMTGVVRSHRRRGIAIAMKVMVIQRARELGMTTIRTFHHPANEAPIAVNKRLGYVDFEGPAPTA